MAKVPLPITAGQMERLETVALSVEDVARDLRLHAPEMRDLRRDLEATAGVLWRVLSELNGGGRASRTIMSAAAAVVGFM